MVAIAPRPRGLISLMKAYALSEYPGISLMLVFAGGNNTLIDVGHTVAKPGQCILIQRRDR
ncbi:hypothetical protein D3C81_2287310 [compost metagenome]